MIVDGAEVAVTTVQRWAVGHVVLGLAVTTAVAVALQRACRSGSRCGHG